MTGRRTGRRLGALLGAAAIAAALPAVPAAAQQAPATSAPSGKPTPVEAMAVPPPLEPGWPVPRATNQPDAAYELKTPCIAPAGQPFDLKNKPWGQNQMQFDDLHKFSRGAGVTVAVIDTGVAPHDYLTVRGGGDYVRTDEQNGLKDCDGHGTEVAGIIAAHPPENSDIGFVGIAPDAEILSIRQSSANYKGKRITPDNPDPQEDKAGTLETLAQSIVAAADQGAKVINMSVDSCRQVAINGVKLPIQASEKNLQAALRYAHDTKDVVLVASAGNYGTDTACTQGINTGDPSQPSHLILPPWFSEYVISVAAIQDNGDPADFSIPGPWVTVAAPGTRIISLDPTTRTGLVNLQIVDGKPQPIQGTSFAAPYVAGLAALIRSAKPELKAAQVAERIKTTAIHPAAPGGRDNRIGYGMINPMAALTAVIPSERGVRPDAALDMKADLPGPVVHNWLPMQVAVVGSAGGVLLLLLTLFIVHTVRRNKGRREVRGSA
ncbi:type VII secretion-associated serine protease mycosin [Actinokineospora bangkokensis]|uniref:Type VII secretion-associated serine protease mycosin n=1 Tax=Actinokineospora bangkokensis TaxID=1193682 RepID=A0A1Q9LEZ2_9PSEU|nr:type VII secretion-associated serine protease mycosin [Actinokineospora bangkokensis]OLR90607.1 type VII secretion-associated serine protease mycosin [Actinokineospora bangkokensis]